MQLSSGSLALMGYLPPRSSTCRVSFVSPRTSGGRIVWVKGLVRRVASRFSELRSALGLSPRLVMLVSDLQRSAPDRAELLLAQLREALEANRALELPARLALPSPVVASASEIRDLAPDRVDALLAQLRGALQANRALELPARLALRCGIVS